MLPNIRQVLEIDDSNGLQVVGGMPPGLTAFLVIWFLLMLIHVAFAHAGMFRELKLLYVRPRKIWNMYLTTVLFFASLYFFIFCMGRQQFYLTGYDTKENVDAGISQSWNSETVVFIFFCYLSGTIVTSTGFGDISPAHWVAMMACNLQMIVGTIYHVAIFGLALSHFRTLQKLTQPPDRHDDEINLTDMLIKLSKWVSANLYRRIVDALAQPELQHRVKEFLVHARQFITRHVLIISFCIQLFNTLLLFALDDPFVEVTPNQRSQYYKKMGIIAASSVIVTLQFIAVLSISLRLVQNVDSGEITPNFLLQSYIATILLFGNAYFLLCFALSPSEWSSSIDRTAGVFEVMYTFIHLSFTTFTTTGFGDIYARGPWSRMSVIDLLATLTLHPQCCTRTNDDLVIIFSRDYRSGYICSD